MANEPELDLIAVQGATLNRQFTLRQDGSPVDLTSWTPSLIIMREHGGTQLYEITPSNGLTIPTPASGQIVMSVFAGGGGWSLAVGKYRYRMRLIASPTDVWALWVGDFVVRPQ